MSDLQVIQNDRGDYFVGFDADGTFVSVATVSAARVKQLQERAANLAELSKADDAASVARHDEAAASLPYTSKGTSTSKAASETKGGAS